ncbi:MAG: hypothetical protein WCG83_07065 [Candidatus Peregrinibacteria bacterium]
MFLSNSKENGGSVLSNHRESQMNSKNREFVGRAILVAGILIAVVAFYHQWTICGIVGVVVMLLAAIFLAFLNKEMWAPEKNPLPPPTKEERNSAGKILAGMLFGLGLLVGVLAWVGGEPTSTVLVASVISVCGGLSLAYQTLWQRKIVLRATKLED